MQEGTGPSPYFGARCHRCLLGVCVGAQLHLSCPPAAATQEPVSMAGKCDTIYKGFAGCLISLGDSMAQSVRQQQQQEEGTQEAQELDTICK